MVGWHVSLKTPQFPHGRPLVIVANDCTVQSGSFGIAEDDFFDKVSKYARGLGLPRLHIASNSGARIGLAEELKPYFKVRPPLLTVRFRVPGLAYALRVPLCCVCIPQFNSMPLLCSGCMERR